MISFSFISLLSGIISVIAIIIVLSIFNKVYQEDYKKPWLFIGISTLFLGSSQILRFLAGFFNIYIINLNITEATTYMLDFISIMFLTYGLILEQVILKYFKGKFVKMKFIPVQEGTLGGEIDLNVSNGSSYIAVKKDKKYLLEQFSQATKKGFEGFLITEDNPKQIRSKYNLQKTPIAWISQIDMGIDSNYLKDSLDENSDIVDPLQLNNLITFVDNFLEQSQNPFLMVDLNLLLRTNNYTIVLEFLKYLTSRTERFNGILITLINIDIIKNDQIQELQTFMNDLES
ncbi:MAG: DUF835 domain-containing protein [Candidatus Woesearchaeota archaeon]|nr:DUF835 domain-containing protein [Candidatus Woesearchaeota archaeon]